MTDYHFRERGYDPEELQRIRRACILAARAQVEADPSHKTLYVVAGVRGPDAAPRYGASVFDDEHQAAAAVLLNDVSWFTTLVWK